MLNATPGNDRRLIQQAVQVMLLSRYHSLRSPRAAPPPDWVRMKDSSFSCKYALINTCFASTGIHIFLSSSCLLLTQLGKVFRHLSERLLMKIPGNKFIQSGLDLSVFPLCTNFHQIYTTVCLQLSQKWHKTTSVLTIRLGIF